MTSISKRPITVSTQIKRPIDREELSIRVRLLLLVASLAAYAGIIYWLYPHIGIAVTALAVFPVMVAGYFFGTLTGLAVSIITIALTVGLVTLFRYSSWQEIINVPAIPRIAALLLVGTVSGWLSDLRRRLRLELEQRKRLERSMRESEERLASVLVAINDAVYSLSLPDKQLISANPAAEKLFGHPLAELLADPSLFTAGVFHQDREEVDSYTANLLDQKMGDKVYRIIRPSGEIRWVHDRGNVVTDNSSRPIRMVRLVSDITERKIAEEVLLRAKTDLEVRVMERTTELRSTNIKLQYELAERMKAEKLAEKRASEAEEGKRILDALLTFIPEGIAIASAPDVAIQRISQHGLEMLGDQVITIEGLPLGEQPTPWRIYHLDGVTPAAVSELPLTRAVQTGEMIQNEEWLLLRPDGNPLSILCNAGPIRNRYEEVVGGILSWRDITDRKQALKTANEQAEQIEAQHYLLKGREMERLTTARNLHDGLLQNLITISFAFNEAYRVSTDDNAKKVLIAIRSSLQEQINNLRNFCGELRPPILVHFGLEKTIRSHIERFQADHPQISVQANLVYDAQRLPEDLRLALFRIYNELMNNIVKHARASHIFIRYSLENNCAELEVADNGSGFEVPSGWIDFVRQGHLGLVGIRERVESLGGTFKVVSAVGKGTIVRVSLPDKSAERAVERQNA